MKLFRQMTSLILVLAMLCSFLPAVPIDVKAAEVEEPADVSIVKEGKCGIDVTWTLDSNGVLIITGTGDMIANYYNYEVAYEGVPWYPYRKQIKKVIIVDGVTCIDHYAFFECANLTHITIPDSISSIGNYAFPGCHSLTDVYYDGSESKWSKVSVGKDNENLTDAEIHYVNAGGECDHNYTAAVMAATCTEPGYTVFTCTVCEYSYVDFMDATGHNYADGMCAACGKVDPEYVFPDDSIIASGTCGDAVTWSLSSDGVLMISGTGHMTTYYASYEDIPWYPDRELINTVVIEDGVESIGYDAFYGCTNLAYVTIPDSVTFLGSSAFENCVALTNIVIPSSVTAIKGEAFRGCAGLNAIVIPDSVTNLGTGAFSDCTGLASVIIPESVETIDGSVFSGCTNLTSAGPIGSGCSIEFGWTETIPDNVFYGADALTNVIIPEGITSIGDHAFSSCTNLPNVTLPEGITSIGDYAFSSCTNLTNMTLPESVSSIGEHAFSNCNQMTAINIPSKVTRIEDHTFWSCGDLSGITIPQGVTYIGESAFDGCHALTDIVLPDSLTYIGLSAFSFTGLTSVIIPESVTSVNSSVFNNCDDLEHVTIPGSLTSFVGGIFYDCPKLTSAGPIGSGCSVEFGWINSIPESAFKTWITLESVILPESISTIEAYAFANCGNLTSIELPEKVTSIGYQAFNNCRNLTSITFSNRMETIANGAFQYCDSLTDVVYCGSEEDWANMKIGIDNECLTNATIHYSSSDETYGHSYSAVVTAPTCTEQGYTTYTCAYCGDSYMNDYVAATGHAYDEGVVTTAPTCTHPGIKILTCANDPTHTYQEEVMAYGHSASVAEEVVPTCTEQGYTTYICDTCGYSYVDNYIDANGHDYVDGSCSACGEVDSNYIIAQGTCGENLTWVLTANGILTISGEGEMMDYESTDDIPWSNRDAILRVIIGDSVTTIGDNAFFDCDNLTNVVIGDSVTTIGDSAFEFCRSLTSVTIPYSVTTIDDQAFSYCDGLTSVTIGGSVTTIGWYAFSDCDSLTSVTIPDSVTIIGNEAFSYCDRLTSVTIGDNVTTIDDGAFFNCDNLTNVVIGDSVTTIGVSAFYDCDSLTSVTIPDSVTTICDRAFSNCDSLTSVTIGNSVTTIGDNAFYDCDSLVGIFVEKGNPAYSSDANGVLFNKDKTKLIKVPDTISGSYVIPDSVTTIGYRAFSNCDSLTNVAIGDSVTTIGDSAFSYCDSLTSVIIPDSVTTIDYHAFSYCDRLTSVTIGDSVTNIYTNAFYDCDSLVGIFVEDGNPTYSSDVNGVLFTKKKTKLIKVPDAISGSYVIPDSVIYIGDDAFYDCDSLTSVTIPDSVIYIGDSAFKDCDSLTSVTIGNSVTTIGDSAFYDCDSLTSVTIPDSVITIGSNAFNFCYSLTSVTIGNSVTTIGDDAFRSCNSLTSVIIGDSVTTIGDSAFEFCRSLTSVTIPDSVTDIDYYAFYDCDSLTDVYYAGSEAEWAAITIDLHNEDLTNATIHFNSSGPDNGETGETSVRYFREWVPERQVVCWGKESDNVFYYESLVTDETDRSFLNHLDELIGNYVLVKTKENDQGLVGVDVVLSIKPLETVDVGVVTAISTTDRTITIEGTTYAYTCEFVEEVPKTGDYVRFCVYEGKIVSLVILESSSNESIRYFTNWDEPSQTATFGRDVQSMVKATEDTDRSFLNDLDNLLGKYVLVECITIDGVTELVSIKAVETKVGHVTAIDGTSVTIDGIRYEDSGWSLLRGISADDYILYHVYEGSMIYAEVLAIRYCNLVDWNEDNREFAVEFDAIFSDSKPEVFTYPLSVLADSESLAVLEKFSSETTVVRIQVAYDNQKIAYNIREARYELVVSSDYSNLSFPKAAVMTLAVGLMDSGKYIDDLTKITFQIADTSIIDVDSSYIEGHYRYILLKGLKAGTTIVTIFDSERQVKVKLRIAVSDSQGHYYTLSTVPTVYVEEYPTNFYNVNGLYIDNYKYEIDENRTAKVSFDAYNTNYTYGVVEIYDGKGNLYSAVLIKRMKSCASSLKTVLWDDVGCLIRDAIDQDFLTYRQESGYSKCSHVSVEVPPGGYLKISMDPSSSIVSALVNAGDLMISVGKLSKTIDNAIDADAFAEELTKEMLINEAYLELMKADEKFEEKLWKNVGKQTFLTSESVGDFVDTVANNIDELNLGYILADTAIHVGFSIGEKLLTYLAGPARPYISTIFIIGRTEDVLYQCADISKLQKTGSIVIQNQGGGSRNLNQIRVESRVDFSDDTALSVFKVELDSEDLADLKISDPELYDAISAGNTYSYNISLLKAGVEVQPESEVTVYIPIPSELKKLATDNKVKVYRVETDGTLTEMQTSIKDDFFVFTTDHFSLYTIVGFASDDVVHKHVADSNTWNYDGATHWHICTVCEEVMDLAAHSGGTATCAETAVCSVCGTPYGSTDSTNHAGETEIRNAKEAGEFTEGYTGDIYCLGCDKQIASGETIPATHVHEHTAVVTDPTCTGKGNTTYTCSCGDTYTADETAELGHITVIDKAVEATCTETGLTEGKHCSACNEVLIAQEEVPALGHAWDEGTVTKKPTETDTGIRTYSCERCEETRTEDIPILDHQHSYSTVISEPTCTETGFTTYICSCGDSYTDDEVDALGHNVVIDQAVPATCTENGLTEGKHCTRCDAETVEQEEIPALGHAYENGLCGVCGDQDPDYVEPEKPNKPNRPGWGSFFDKWFGNWWGDQNKCDHSYTSAVTAPTCTAKGYTTYTCSKCGDSYKDAYTNALGHTWDNGMVTEAPTCTKNGVKTYTCETCKNQKTETIKATGHFYENGICSGCGAEEPTKPSEPSKPNKPGWIFDWIFGSWWK